jgi:hypothetical protein
VYYEIRLKRIERVFVFGWGGGWEQHSIAHQQMLHDICWIFCMQRCIPVDVLFILKFIYIVLYINERVVLQCCMNLY